MVISGLVFERNWLLVSSYLYHIQAQENLCDRVVNHTPNCTPSMYATHFNYNCWYRKAIIHKLKPYKAWWSFSHSPLGSLSSVIDNPYHPTKYQRTGKKPWQHPSLRKVIVIGDSDSLANCRHFPVSAVNYSFSLFYGLLSGLGSLLRMFCFLWLSQLKLRFDWCNVDTCNWDKQFPLKHKLYFGFWFFVERVYNVSCEMSVEWA